jgi:GGDEF domain-containing protein
MASGLTVRGEVENELLRLLTELPLGNPFRPSVMRWAAASGITSDPAALLQYWRSREIGGPSSLRRYRWDLLVPGAFAELADRPLFWRPREIELAHHDPTAFAARLLVPVVVADSAELLAEIGAGGRGVVPETAQFLLTEARTTIDDDLATFVLMSDPWRDTLALWLFARRPHLLDAHRTLLVSLAVRYGAAARLTAGIASGRLFPFQGEPLVSASAALAVGLLVLGVYPSLLPGLVAFVGREQRLDGGWGDPRQPSDVLTTLVAADLLGHLNPDFDPEPVLAFLAGKRDTDGAWRAYGPEAPWVTAELGGFLASLDRPFADRFRWPHVDRSNRDRRTGLAAYTYFDDLVRFLADLELLRDEPLGVAYLDLAGFGKWNNAHGMDAGDEVLRLVGECLAEIPAARSIRDGGDEFIVVGAPRRPDLEADLQAFRAAWPARFARRFGARAITVPPRIITTVVAAGQLAKARDDLSRGLGRAKERFPRPNPDGIQERLVR